MDAAQHKTVNRAATTQPAAAIKQVQRKTNNTMSTPIVQASMKVSRPHDPEEKEAEDTSRKVMRMAIPDSQIVYTRDAEGGVFRQVDKREEQDRKKPKKEKKLQGKFLSPYISRFSVAGLFAKPRAGLVQRKLEGQPDVSGNVAADINSSMSEGTPLPLSVRRFMEPRFNADFSKVRVHEGDKATKLNRRLSAQAFTVGNHIFFGKDKFQPHHEEGKQLLAHELTHTIQQGGAVQRSEDVTVSSRTSPQVQRSWLSDALDYIADKANWIPGFRLFTLVLGVNPINMSRVERTPANLLRAVIEVMPGGALISKALDNYGIVDKIANWVMQQLHTLGMVGSSIKKALMSFLDSLGWTDIFHPGDVWDRAKRIFTDPIDRIKSFISGLVSGIIKFIKDAILRPLASLAQGTRGYDLLCAVLGHDPITGDPVPQTADTLIGGFMKLIGQEAIWENLKKAKAIPRAWAWFKGALAGLLGFVRQIPSLFVRALESLQLVDIILVPRAFAKVAGVFGHFIISFVRWAGNTMWSLLQIIFEVVAPGVMPYLRRAGRAFRTIIRNPVRFIHNLIRAGKRGFLQFGKNFLKHLQTSLIQWLTGALAGANIYIPQGLTLREIVKFVLSVLGLTWQNIRQKLVRVIGETAVKALETGFDIVVTLVREGPMAAWDKIKEQLGNLKDIVIEQIISFVNSKIVQLALTKLLALLSPVGAFIQAIIAIYNTIMFFIERLRQIVQVATSILNSIVAIANGVITAAANRVEHTLEGLLTLVISFLARFAGLGKVSTIVTNIINKIRAPIDRALDRIVDWIVTMAKKAGGLFMRGVRSAVTSVSRWWKDRKTFKAADGENHSLFFVGEDQGAILKVRSEEQPFLDFVSKANVGTDEKKRTAKREALRIAGLIENERKKTPTGTPEQIEAAQAQKAANVNTFLEQLKSHTSVLFGPTIPDSFKGNANAGVNSVGFGISMRVKPLTNKNRPTGSPPTSSNNPTYAALNERRQSAGGASYYIKGHLLNQLLGGPGSWINLTPLSRSGNAQHERQAESIVKHTVDLPAIVEYAVKSNYGSRSDKSSLLARIQNSTDDIQTKQIKSSIVHAEEWVPHSLSVEGYILDESLQRRNTFLNQAITNSVNRDYTSYFLATTPRPQPVNLSTDSAARIASVPGIGMVLAQRIVDLRVSRGRRFATYQQISDGVPGIGTDRLQSLESAGHVKLY